VVYDLIQNKRGKRVGGFVDRRRWKNLGLQRSFEKVVGPEVSVVLHSGALQIQEQCSSVGQRW
jgi:hypothetical protein